MSDSGPTFPFPIGTLVFGGYKDSGWPLRFSCEHHIFEIVSAPKKVDWGNSGFAQAAKCLFCGGAPTAEIDSYFWWRLATPMDLVGFLGEIEGTLGWFTELKERIHDVLGGKPKAPLLNFD